MKLLNPIVAFMLAELLLTIALLSMTNVSTQSSDNTTGFFKAEATVKRLSDEFTEFTLPSPMGLTKPTPSADSAGLKVSGPPGAAVRTRELFTRVTWDCRFGARFPKIPKA